MAARLLSLTILLFKRAKRHKNAQKYTTCWEKIAQRQDFVEKVIL